MKECKPAGVSVDRRTRTRHGVHAVWVRPEHPRGAAEADGVRTVEEDRACAQSKRTGWRAVEEDRVVKVVAAHQAGF